jgi:hypothetical protein
MTLPLELDQIIAGNLANIKDFISFKAAFGISNLLLYSAIATSPAQFEIEFWAFLNSKQNHEIEELTIVKMLKAKNHAIGTLL